MTGSGPEGIPAGAPAEVLAFNKTLGLDTLHLPKIYEVGPEVAREAREEGKSVFGALASVEYPDPPGRYLCPRASAGACTLPD